MKIPIKSVQLFCLGSIYFQKEEKERSNINYKESYDFLKKSEEITGLELFELDMKSISESGKLYLNKNKMEIFFKVDIKKMNDFQNGFKEIYKEFNPESRKMAKVIDASMTINFNISDIEFMFYQGDFHSIINNNGEPELYIYLKKLYYEFLIKRKKKYEEEKELILPIFPLVNSDNQIKNLKFHDIVIQIKIKTKDLFDLIIKYE